MDFDAVFDNVVNPTYRYSLTRIWDRSLEKVVIIMLNPSIANVLKNDLSVNRCLNYCIDHNYGALEIVNLFAYIGTDSKKVGAGIEFIGEENERYIYHAIESADVIIVAWGSDKDYRNRKREVWNRFLKGRKLYYFEDGSDRTPPIHISRLSNGFYLKEYYPNFK